MAIFFHKGLGSGYVIRASVLLPLIAKNIIKPLF